MPSLPLSAAAASSATHNVAARTPCRRHALAPCGGGKHSSRAVAPHGRAAPLTPDTARAAAATPAATAAVECGPRTPRPPALQQSVFERSEKAPTTAASSAAPLAAGIRG